MPAFALPPIRLPPRATATTPHPEKDPPAATARTSTIIVPGKFDAFHVGHRALAAAAAERGAPTLLSFAGMAAELGWPPRAPVVPPGERARLLADWGRQLGTPVAYRLLPFADVRELSPEAFVRVLAEQFSAGGVVCGVDWRFGRGAAGRVDDLRALGARFGVDVTVVAPVVVDGGVASSTRVRDALATGDVGLVARLLGRLHRVVGVVVKVEGRCVTCAEFVNQVPGDGAYEAVVRVLGRAEPFRTHVVVTRASGEVCVDVIDAETVYCEECEVYIDFVEGA